jgi:hypothetical protein
MSGGSSMSDDLSSSSGGMHASSGQEPLPQHDARTSRQGGRGMQGKSGMGGRNTHRSDDEGMR